MPIPRGARCVGGRCGSGTVLVVLVTRRASGAEGVDVSTPPYEPDQATGHLRDLGGGYPTVPVDVGVVPPAPGWRVYRPARLPGASLQPVLPPCLQPVPPRGGGACGSWFYIAHPPRPDRRWHPRLPRPSFPGPQRGALGATHRLAADGIHSSTFFSHFSATLIPPGLTREPLSRSTCRSVDAGRGRPPWRFQARGGARHVGEHLAGGPAGGCRQRAGGPGTG